MASTVETQLPTASRDRVRAAHAEVGQTAIAPRVASTLVVASLLVLFVVPALQLRALWQAQTEPGPSRRADVGMADAAPAALMRGPQALGSLVAANRALLAAIGRVERTLEDESVAARAVRPWIQIALTRFGAGTEQTYQGRERWLFYRPDVDYVTGPGFLQPRALERRRATGDTLTTPPQPDPLVAIRDLHAQLSARAVTLIVMPTPVKPSMHPEKLARAADRRDAPVENASYRPFVDALRSEGVLVFDVAAALARERREGTGALYLVADTHWRPAAVETAARQLHAFIRQHVDLPPRAAAGYVAQREEIENAGDILRLLDLPPGQSLYPPERVRIRRILTPAGARWTPDAGADVLVLGDSFTNIYSIGAMGWGDAAGLVEQLSFEMQRPIDRLARNDSGAFASREMLAAELARGRDRLAGKRLVIFQFAARELAFGDWKMVALDRSDRAPLARFLTPRPGQSLQVEGVVRAIGPMPRPGTVPYKDHIVALHLDSLAAGGTPLDPGQALVFVWSMRDNLPTAASRYRPRDVVVLQLRPWSEVAQDLEGINRGELDDAGVQLAEPWWGEPVDP